MGKGCVLCDEIGGSFIRGYTVMLIPFSAIPRWDPE